MRAWTLTGRGRHREGDGEEGGGGGPLRDPGAFPWPGTLPSPTPSGSPPQKTMSPRAPPRWPDPLVALRAAFYFLIQNEFFKNATRALAQMSAPDTQTGAAGYMRGLVSTGLGLPQQAGPALFDCPLGRSRSARRPEGRRGVVKPPRCGEAGCPSSADREPWAAGRGDCPPVRPAAGAACPPAREGVGAPVPPPVPCEPARPPEAHHP